MSAGADPWAMRAVVAVLTHNAMSTLRVDLLEQTLRSLDEAFPDAERKVLCDNGSTDGSFEALSDEGCPFTRTWEVVRLRGTNTTPGGGKNAMLPVVLGSWPPPSPPKLIVTSDDDMRWRPEAGETLLRFWSHERCPERLAIVSALLEPDYPWNTPRRTVSVGGGYREDTPRIAALVRDSAPGAAWTFRYGGGAHGIGPHYFACQSLLPGSAVRGRRTVFVDDFGYDYAYCRELADSHLDVAQIDLAEHLGWEASTHGNRAVDNVNAKPLDRKRWGL